MRRLIALAKTAPEAIANVGLTLRDRVEALEKRIAELERNSRTSSPSSTDRENLTTQVQKPPPKIAAKNGGGKNTPARPGNKSQTQTMSPAMILQGKQTARTAAPT